MKTQPVRMGDPAAIPGILLGVTIIVLCVGYMVAACWSFPWVPT